MPAPVHCPTCKKPIDAADMADVKRPGSTFPFCSPRCRDVDLYRWFDERYQIPVIDDDEAHDGDESSPPPRDPPDADRGS
ncbi:MAG: DNA gyrase inhibitor YacG [Phycisphaerae bacterium]